MTPSQHAEPSHITSLISQLQEQFEPSQISTKMTDRVAYARDQWPRSLILFRQGQLETLPDLIVWPKTAEETAWLLVRCHEAETNVIATGSGSGVTGAASPMKKGTIIDLKRLDRIRWIDHENGLAEVEAGIIGQHLEESLQRYGMTLGHFPSSIMCSTLGGWAATRSAGQASSRYGKIEDMVVNIQLAMPDGSLFWTHDKADLTQLVIGSEGRFGLMTACRIRIHKAPRSRQFRGILFPNIEAGLAAAQAMMQSKQPPPAILRLYNPLDTAISSHKKADTVAPSQETPLLPLVPIRQASQKLPVKSEQASIPTKRAKQLTDFWGNWLKRTLEPTIRSAVQSVINKTSVLDRVLPQSSLMILGTEGDTAYEANQLLEEHLKLCTDAEGKDLGEGPGWHWFNARYSVSFKQSTVYINGAFSDTMEVAASWENLPQLYQKVRDVLQQDAAVMAHFSHVYPEGCSIYFSFVSLTETENEIETYDRLWKNGLQAAIDAGGSISHHHGIGYNKAQAMRKELGPIGMGLMQAVRRAFDPTGHLNPGKLGLDATRTSPSSSNLPSVSSKEEKPILTLLQFKGKLPHLPWDLLDEQSRHQAKELWHDEEHTLPLLKLTQWEDVRDLLQMSFVHAFPIYTAHGPAPSSKRGLVLDLSPPKTGLPTFSIDQSSMLLSCDSRYPIESIESYARMAGLTTGIRSDTQFTLRQWVEWGLPHLNDVQSGLAPGHIYSISVLLPNGEELELGRAPRSSAGPDLKELFWQTHGTFGIVTRVTLRLRKVNHDAQVCRSLYTSRRAGLHRLKCLMNGQHKPEACVYNTTPSNQRHTLSIRFAKKQQVFLSAAYNDEQNDKETTVKASERILKQQELSAFPVPSLPEHPWWLAVTSTWTHLDPIADLLLSTSPWPINRLKLIHATHERGTWLVTFGPPIKSENPEQLSQKLNQFASELRQELTSAPFLQISGDPRRFIRLSPASKAAQIITAIKEQIDPHHSLNPHIELMPSLTNNQGGDHA